MSPARAELVVWFQGRQDRVPQVLCVGDHKGFYN